MIETYKFIILHTGFIWFYHSEAGHQTLRVWQPRAVESSRGQRWSERMRLLGRIRWGFPAQVLGRWFPSYQPGQPGCHPIVLPAEWDCPPTVFYPRGGACGMVVWPLCEYPPVWWPVNKPPFKPPHKVNPICSLLFYSAHVDGSNMAYTRTTWLHYMSAHTRMTNTQ